MFCLTLLWLMLFLFFHSISSTHNPLQFDFSKFSLQAGLVKNNCIDNWYLGLQMKTNGANLSPTHNEKPSSITPTALNSYPAKFSLDPMAPSQFTDEWKLMKALRFQHSGLLHSNAWLIQRSSKKYGNLSTSRFLNSHHGIWLQSASSVNS